MDLDDDFILNEPSYYLDKENYKNVIDNLFCVGNLSKTRILAPYMRPLRIVKKFREKFKISYDCDIEEINKKLFNLKVGIIRRKTINGIKQDNDFFIDSGFIVSIENCQCFNFSYAVIKTINGIEKIKTNRVYFLLEQ